METTSNNRLYSVIVFLINIIVLVLMIALPFVYIFLSKRSVSPLRDYFLQTLPSINAGLMAYLAVYFVIVRRGISKEQMLKQDIINGTAELVQISDLQQRMKSVGFSNFYASRNDYALYRGEPELIDFLSSAQNSIWICAHWISHGTEIEGISSKIAELAKNPKRINITIGIINPRGPAIKSVSDYFNISEDVTTAKISYSLQQLYSAKQSLPKTDQKRFIIKTYDTLPVASIIMVDPFMEGGRLQIDLKAYRIERQNSFGIELKNWKNQHNQLYKLCRDSWIDLLKNATEYKPAEVQS